MPQLDPIHVSVKDAARLCGICVTSLYLAIGRGELTAVKDGAKTKITYASIKQREASLPLAKIKRR
jgi:hypothetical protein